MTTRTDLPDSVKGTLELRSAEEFEALLWAIRIGIDTINGEWGTEVERAQDKREIRRNKRGLQRLHGRMFTLSLQLAVAKSARCGTEASATPKLDNSGAKSKIVNLDPEGYQFLGGNTHPSLPEGYGDGPGSWTGGRNGQR